LTVKLHSLYVEELGDGYGNFVKVGVVVEVVHFGKVGVAL